jgi:hypothetical protein
MLHVFVNKFRPNKDGTLDELFAAISAYRATAQEGLGNALVLEAAREQARGLMDLIATAKLRDALDPAIPCLVKLCRDVGQRLGSFRLIHNHSNTISRHALMLLSLETLPELTPSLKPSPLPAVEISFADSASVPQLQIADWTTGATRQVADCWATEKDDRFADLLAPLVEHWLSGGLWPDSDTLSTLRSPTL